MKYGKELLIGLVVILLIYFWFRPRNTNNQSGGSEEGPVFLKPQQISSYEPKYSNKVFLEIKQGRRNLGKIVIQLYPEVVPRTCENFRQLCTGEGEKSSLNSFQMSYHSTPFHRVIKDFMIQGGDITDGDGTGGFSIYGKNFEDENFQIKHTERGQLSMANAGPNTNGSQFFITSRACPHLDGKHVVFGKVLTGLSILDEIENSPTNGNDRPLTEIVISNCGEVLD